MIRNKVLYTSVSSGEYEIATILAEQEKCSFAELIRRLLRDRATQAGLWPPPETPAERAALVARMAQQIEARYGLSVPSSAQQEESGGDSNKLA